MRGILEMRLLELIITIKKWCSWDNWVFGIAKANPVEYIREVIEMELKRNYSEEELQELKESEDEWYYDTFTRCSQCQYPLGFTNEPCGGGGAVKETLILCGLVGFFYYSYLHIV